MRRRAWAPAHISAFFSPHIADSAGATGSIGAGFCLERGVTAEVDIRPGGGEKSFFFNGAEQRLSVTESAVNILERAAGQELNGRFDLLSPYPDSQGFGISAAGTLAVSIAVSDLLSLPIESAWLAAHTAEVSGKTGLGDVVAGIKGGAVLRLEPGLPREGGRATSFRILNDGEDVEVVVAVLGEKLRTSSVLSSEASLSRVSLYGRSALERLLAEIEGSSVSAGIFAEISREFSRRSGILTPEISAAFDMLEDGGIADKYPFSMVMLGNSIFFLPPRGIASLALEEIKGILSPAYPSAGYHLNRVGEAGAHLLE